MAAAVMLLPDKPIMGEMGRKLKTVYNAVKQTVKAISLVESLL
jgi:acetylglutamate kinase